MGESYEKSREPQLPASGLVAQGVDGMWYGWQNVIDDAGNVLPYLVSQDGCTSLTLEQAASFGVALPAGYSVEAHTQPWPNQPREQLPEIAPPRTQNPEQVSTPPAAQNTFASQSNTYDNDIDNDGVQNTSTAGLRSLAGIDIGKKLNLYRKYSERQANPDKWLYCDGWGVATASFVRGNDAAREQLLQVMMAKSKIIGRLASPILRSPTRARRATLFVTKTSPIALPVEALTPIPGDEVLTASVATAVIVAIAKRRNSIKREYNTKYKN